MIRKTLKSYFRKSTKPSSAFSSFFVESSSREKTKVMKETVRKSNGDQKDLVGKYEKMLNASEQIYN